MICRKNLTKKYKNSNEKLVIMILAPRINGEGAIYFLLTLLTPEVLHAVQESLMKLCSPADARLLGSDVMACARRSIHHAISSSSAVITIAIITITITITIIITIAMIHHHHHQRQALLFLLLLLLLLQSPPLLGQIKILRAGQMIKILRARQMTKILRAGQIKIRGGIRSE